MKTRCLQGALCGLCLAWLIAALPSAGAADPAGTVVAVRGDVTAERTDGSTTALGIKDPIFPMDTIRTGDRGRIQISFADDTLLSLGRSTTIQVTEHVFQRSEGQGTLHLRIGEGTFRIVGGIIMKMAPENFRTDTPTATIGVRGSSFAAEVTAEMTKVVLLGTTGAGIVVSNEDGYRIVYNPGTGLIVRRGRAPGRVIEMDALARALLGLTEVGGSDQVPVPPTGALEDASPGPYPEVPTPAPAPAGVDADPWKAIPGYRTDAEARAALERLLPDGNLEMPYGNAVGIDLESGWALRSLSPEQVSATAVVRGSRLGTITAGGMILHATGTGSSDSTFPEGPAATPPIPFGFDRGSITGNPAIVVTSGSIHAPEARPDVSNWGWWDMQIADPNGAAPPHRVVGLWQGTTLLRTPADWVASALLGKDFRGTYAGDAHCLRNGVERLDGTSAFALDFSRNAFTGNLDFGAAGGPTMDLRGGISRSGIHGQVQSISGESRVASSSMRGFFYGADAHSLQGAFDAQSPANRYIGIFNASGRVLPGAESAPVLRK